MTMIIWNAFRKFIREIWDDIIFAALFFIPIFMAALFHFGVPVLEREICKLRQVDATIAPYYIAFDLCIILMTPIMFSFSGVMVILGELDNGMTKYLIVTPLGKRGYLWSRIGMLSIISMFYSVVVTYIGRLSDISLLQLLYYGIISVLIGAIISFFVITFAHNKVEGMALTKFSSFFVLGIPISLFLDTPTKYVGAVLPSFWATEFILYNRPLDAIMGIISGLVLTWICYRLFIRKMVGA